MFLVKVAPRHGYRSLDRLKDRRFIGDWFVLKLVLCPAAEFPHRGSFEPLGGLCKEVFGSRSVCGIK